MTGKIAVFGGTAEGGLLARELAKRGPVSAFVASREGAELIERLQRRAITRSCLLGYHQPRNGQAATKRLTT